MSVERKPCPEPSCHGDGLDHTDPSRDVETPCPKSEDGIHSEGWYDGEECADCGDPALGPCPGGCTDGYVYVVVGAEETT